MWISERRGGEEVQCWRTRGWLFWENCYKQNMCYVGKDAKCEFNEEIILQLGGCGCKDEGDTSRARKMSSQATGNPGRNIFAIWHYNDTGSGCKY